jgi:hypothetical protein
MGKIFVVFQSDFRMQYIRILCNIKVWILSFRLILKKHWKYLITKRQKFQKHKILIKNFQIVTFSLFFSNIITRFYFKLKPKLPATISYIKRQIHPVLNPQKTAQIKSHHLLPISSSTSHHWNYHKHTKERAKIHFCFDKILLLPFVLEKMIGGTKRNFFKEKLYSFKLPPTNY